MMSLADKVVTLEEISQAETLNYAVYCTTKEDAEEVLKIMYRKGIRWNDGKIAIDFQPWDGIRLGLNVHDRLVYSTTYDINNHILVSSKEDKFQIEVKYFTSQSSHWSVRESSGAVRMHGGKPDRYTEADDWCSDEGWIPVVENLAPRLYSIPEIGEEPIDIRCIKISEASIEEEAKKLIEAGYYYVAKDSNGSARRFTQCPEQCDGAWVDGGDSYVLPYHEYPKVWELSAKNGVVSLEDIFEKKNDDNNLVKNAKFFYNLGYRFIARDEDDSVYVYEQEARKKKDEWKYGGGCSLIDKYTYPELYGVPSWGDNQAISLAELIEYESQPIPLENLTLQATEKVDNSALEDEARDLIKLGCKYVAKDGNDRVYIYSACPIRGQHEWDGEHAIRQIFEDAYPLIFKEVKWTDNKPLLVGSLVSQGTEDSIENTDTEQETDNTLLNEKLDTTETQEWEDKEKNLNKKGEIKMENKNNMVENLLKVVEGYSVTGSQYSITPNGLSIAGKTFSAKEGALLETKGTELISNVPVGFNIPTVAKDIEIGDIVLYDNTPYYVKKKSNDGGKITVHGISPENGLEVIISPTLDLLGQQSFSKILTPFDRMDIGCNPVVNLTTMTALAYAKGGQDEVIKQATPLLIKFATRQDLISKVFADKCFKTFAPLAYVGYTWAQKEGLGLKDIPEKLRVEKLTSKLKSMDKKKLGLVLLVMAVAIYLNKDKISEKLIESKVQEIPVIGRFASPIAKLLNKMPNIKGKLVKRQLEE